MLLMTLKFCDNLRSPLPHHSKGEIQIYSKYIPVLGFMAAQSSRHYGENVATSRPTRLKMSLFLLLAGNAKMFCAAPVCPLV